ncbi:MAG: ABC transporter substrate-binding protein [Deltaproteobacteria bacterium]|nr:ABC transporter substrate-binding protein [Deltaproteobacteria bacterium]
MTKIWLTLVVIFFSFAAHAEALRIVTSLDSLEAKEYIAAFEQQKGVKVDWIRLSAGEALARLAAESTNPTQDVWFGAPAIEFEAAKSKGFLASYQSPAIKMIPAAWRDPDGAWTGIYFGAIVFISGKGVIPPQSWQELLDSRYHNEIVVSYPYTAGTGFTVLNGLLASMGVDAGLDYSAQLDHNIRRYTKSGGAPIIDVGLGEAGVGIVFEQDAIRKGTSRGFPITVTVPRDGVPYEIGAVAIIKGRDSPEAKTFMDWIVSLPAQNLMHAWYRTPLHPRATLPADVKATWKANLAPLDVAWSGAHRQELIQQWREQIGK